jgi:hypothetical protein
MEPTSEAEICAHLRANPDVMYVTPDGHKLYVYVPVKNGVLCITTEEDLSKLDSPNLNAFLQTYLKEAMK